MLRQQASARGLFGVYNPPGQPWPAIASALPSAETRALQCRRRSELSREPSRPLGAPALAKGHRPKAPSLGSTLPNPGAGLMGTFKVIPQHHAAIFREQESKPTPTTSVTCFLLMHLYDMGLDYGRCNKSECNSTLVYCKYVVHDLEVPARPGPCTTVHFWQSHARSTKDAAKCSCCGETAVAKCVHR